jgi:nitrogen-specific signal transduction histidine kinase
MATHACTSHITATQARMLSEEAAVMVLDHKGHLLFATDKLAALLGHPVSALVKMELSALLPQPYCQIHGTWFKVR